jgi:hypothetical protein
MESGNAMMHPHRYSDFWGILGIVGNIQSNIPPRGISGALIAWIEESEPLPSKLSKEEVTKQV